MKIEKNKAEIKKGKVQLPFLNSSKQKELSSGYPVQTIGNNGQVMTKVRNQLGFSQKEYSYYLAVSQHDLTNLKPTEQDDLFKRFSALHKAYKKPMKELFLSFPENNETQQRYIQEMMSSINENRKLRLQQKELNKLTYLEGQIKFTSFVQIFGGTPHALEENLKTFKVASKAVFPVVEVLSKDEVVMLLSLYNNGDQAIKRHALAMTPRGESLDYALSAPQGGLAFDSSPTSYAQGARHRATVTIEAIPSRIPTWWISHITARAEADVVTVDSDFDPQYNPLKSIDSTVTSYGKLINNTQNPTDIQKYEEEQSFLLGLSKKIIDGELMKMVKIRLHVSEYSEEGLGKKVEKLTQDLFAKKFVSTILVNNTKNDYQSFFLSYATQAFIDENMAVGQLRLPTEAIAEGFNHGNVSLSDEMGYYIGETLSGGSMYFNQYTKTSKRLSYSMIISGVMGGGKTSFLKKLLYDHYLSNGKIFGYDVNGEFKGLVKMLNGAYLPLDGRAGIINLLQVFPFVTEEEESSMEIDVTGSFESHLDSLVDRLRAIYPFDGAVATDIRGILLNFYVSIGLWSNPKVPDITALENAAYPTFNELSDYLKNINVDSSRDNYEAYQVLNKIVRTILEQYASLLVGYTTLDKNLDNDIIFFDISRLKNGTSKVYDAIFQASLSLILGLSNKYGKAEKFAYDNGTKSWDSLTRVLICLAECHNILNAEKYYNVSAFDILAREARKYFTAYVADTQMIEGMLPVELPNNLSDEATFAMKKLSNIIGLSQYKVFAKQSEASMDTIKKHFKDQLKPQDYSEMLSYDVSEKGARLKMIISGDRTIDFHARLSREEVNWFKGGA